MTGQQLFLRFACPCAEIRLQRGNILDVQYQALIRMARENDHPDSAFLRQCFRQAVDDLYEFAPRNGNMPWRYDTVLKFWLQHTGPTPVRIGRVTSIVGGVARVAYKEKSENAVNFYDLKFEIGASVCTHNNWIVMIHKTPS